MGGGGTLVRILNEVLHNWAVFGWHRGICRSAAVRLVRRANRLMGGIGNGYHPLLKSGFWRLLHFESVDEMRLVV